MHPGALRVTSQQSMRLCNERASAVARCSSPPPQTIATFIIVQSAMGPCPHIPCTAFNFPPPPSAPSFSPPQLLPSISSPALPLYCFCNIIHQLCRLCHGHHRYRPASTCCRNHHHRCHPLSFIKRQPLDTPSVIEYTLGFALIQYNQFLGWADGQGACTQHARHTQHPQRH